MDLRRSKRVREHAEVLRAECSARGVYLVAGEAEAILAGAIPNVATTIRVRGRRESDRPAPALLLPMSRSVRAPGGARDRGEWC